MYKAIRTNLINKKFDPEMLKEIEDQERSEKHLESELEEINQDEEEEIVEKFNPLLFMVKEMEKAYKQAKILS